MASVVRRARSKRSCSRLRSALVVVLVCVAGVCDCAAEDGDQQVREESLSNLLPSFVCLGEARALCACQRPFSDTECRSVVAEWLAAARTELTYSAECATRTLSSFSDFNSHLSAAGTVCSPDPTQFRAWLDCADECQIYHGTAEAGDACVRFGRFMSTCAEDLRCGADLRCHAPCDAPTTIPDGGACNYASGILRERCEPPSTCELAAGVCTIQLATDDACDPFASACPSGTWCAPEFPMSAFGTCTPTADDGALCSYDEACRSGVCIEQVCRVADPYGCGHPYF